MTIENEKQPIEDEKKEPEEDKFERRVQLVAGLIIWFVMMAADIHAGTNLLAGEGIESKLPMLKYGFAIILIIGTKESVILIKELIVLLTSWKSK